MKLGLRIKETCLDGCIRFCDTKMKCVCARVMGAISFHTDQRQIAYIPSNAAEGVTDLVINSELHILQLSSPVHSPNTLRTAKTP